MLQRLLCAILDHAWDGADYVHHWASSYRCKRCGEKRTPLD